MNRNIVRGVGINWRMKFLTESARTEQKKKKENVLLALCVLLSYAKGWSRTVKQDSQKYFLLFLLFCRHRWQRIHSIHTLTLHKYGTIVSKGSLLAVTVFFLFFVSRKWSANNTPQHWKDSTRSLALACTSQRESQTNIWLKVCASELWRIYLIILKFNLLPVEQIQTTAATILSLSCDVYFAQLRK